MSGPTLEQIGRLAVRLVRTTQRAVDAQEPRARREALDEADGTWSELEALVDQYGDKVDPPGGGQCLG